MVVVVGGDDDMVVTTQKYARFFWVDQTTYDFAYNM